MNIFPRKKIAHQAISVTICFVNLNGEMYFAVQFTAFLPLTTNSHLVYLNLKCFNLYLKLVTNSHLKSTKFSLPKTQ